MSVLIKCSDLTDLKSVLLYPRVFGWECISMNLINKYDCAPQSMYHGAVIKLQVYYISVSGRSCKT